MFRYLRVQERRHRWLNVFHLNLDEHVLSCSMTQKKNREGCVISYYSMTPWRDCKNRKCLHEGASVSHSPELKLRAPEMPRQVVTGLSESLSWWHWHAAHQNLIGQGCGDLWMNIFGSSVWFPRWLFHKSIQELCQSRSGIQCIRLFGRRVQVKITVICSCGEIMLTRKINQYFL